MEVLFVFLKWVASFAHLDEETGSKMDLGNLATVICPSILYSRGRDAIRDESFGAIRVITTLLENQDEFFTVPQEFLPILHDQEYFANSMELPAKDFMRKCDTYQKVKAGNGRNPGPPYNLSNGSGPHFPPPNSPTTERPPMGMSAMSDRNIRPHPGMPQSANSYSSNSPAFSQAMPPPRTPDEWPAAPPRPINPGAVPGSAPNSRPSSFVQPRASTDQQANAFSPNPNGYPVRQRT